MIIDTCGWIIIVVAASICCFLLGIIVGSLCQMERDAKWRREREIQDRIIELERKVGVGKFKGEGE